MKKLKGLLFLLFVPYLSYAASMSGIGDMRKSTYDTDNNGIVDNAEAGDSATAFFSSGTIEHERGGLEADVSGYSGLIKISGGSTSQAVAGTDYELPLTFSTGLTRSANTITVNTTQNITNLSNLTSNGFVKTSGGDGTLSIDTNTYLTTETDPDFAAMDTEAELESHLTDVTDVYTSNDSNISIDTITIATSGLLNTTPNGAVDIKSLVNKEYVDLAVTSLGAVYYMYDENDGTGYKTCYLNPSFDSETYIDVASLADDDYIGGWISASGEAPTKLLKGVYNWYLTAEKTAGTQELRIYWKLVERKSDDSEIVIATSSNSNVITDKGDYIVPLQLSSDYLPDSGSRIVGKLYADISGGGNAPTVRVYYQGSTSSRWEIPANSEIFKNIFVPYSGATKDVDMNTHKISGVVDPENDQDAATKKYVDDNLPDIDTIEQNIYLNAYRIAVNGALTNFNMVNGVVDEFEDESGVDTANSTNEDYDATNDLYGPANTYGSDVCIGGTASAESEFSGDYTAAHACDNDEETRWSTVENPYPTWWKYDLGAGVTKTVRKLRIKPLVGGYGAEIKNFLLQGSNNDSDWTTILDDIVANNDSWQEFTFANSTAYRYYRLYIEDSYGSTYCSIYEIEMMEATGVENMTLISDTFTADEQPDTIKGLMVYKPVDSVTLNTDLKLYFTRDGGTTWTQATLSSVGNLDNGKVMLVGEADVSSQPAGTSIRWKIVTDNNKDLKIYSMEDWWD